MWGRPSYGAPMRMRGGGRFNSYGSPSYARPSHTFKRSGEDDEALTSIERKKARAERFNSSTDNSVDEKTRCRICDDIFAEETLAAHRRSSGHLKKLGLIDGGCRYCGIIAFTNYTNLIEHNLSTVHFEMKAKRLAKNSDADEEFEIVDEHTAGTEKECNEVLLEKVKQMPESKLVIQERSDEYDPNIEYAASWALRTAKGFVCAPCRRFFKTREEGKAHCKEKDHFDNANTALEEYNEYIEAEQKDRADKKKKAEEAVAKLEKEKQEKEALEKEKKAAAKNGDVEKTASARDKKKSETEDDEAPPITMDKDDLGNDPLQDTEYPGDLAAAENENTIEEENAADVSKEEEEVKTDTNGKDE